MKIWLLGAGVTALSGFLGVSWITIASQGSAGSVMSGERTAHSRTQTVDSLPETLVSQIAHLQDQALFVCFDRAHLGDLQRSEDDHERSVQYQHLYEGLKPFTLVHQSLADLQVAERKCNAKSMASVETLHQALIALDRTVSRYRRQQLLSSRRFVE